MLGRCLLGASPGSHRTCLWVGQGCSGPCRARGCSAPTHCQCYLWPGLLLCWAISRGRRRMPGAPRGSQRKGRDCSIGGNRGRGSTICPSHLDLPPAKVKYFKEAQGDDLVNGCMTQVLPCGVGFFVSPILLFTPVGNHGGWGVVAGVSFAQLRLNCASSASHWCEKCCQPFPVPLTQLFLGQQSPYGTSLWLLVELLLPCSIFWGWTVELKRVSTRGAPAPMPLGFGGIG